MTSVHWPGVHDNRIRAAFRVVSGLRHKERAILSLMGKSHILSLTLEFSTPSPHSAPSIASSIRTFDFQAPSTSCPNSRYSVPGPATLNRGSKFGQKEDIDLATLECSTSPGSPPLARNSPFPISNRRASRMPASDVRAHRHLHLRIAALQIFANW